MWWRAPTSRSGEAAKCALFFVVLWALAFNCHFLLTHNQQGAYVQLDPFLWQRSSNNNNSSLSSHISYSSSRQISDSNNNSISSSSSRASPLSNVDNNNDNNNNNNTNNNNKSPRQNMFDWNASTSDDLLQERCFFVEDICRSAHRWFYYRIHPSKRQPELTLHFVGDTRRNSHKGYFDTYRFQRHSDDNKEVDNEVINGDGTGATTTNATSRTLPQCVESPVTNHLVLYDLYNDMLGEFYDRLLVPLYRFTQVHDWIYDAQLYLHNYRPHARLLDSHSLFTSPFRSTLPLLDFASSLLDEPSCTCMARLIFCGYKIKLTKQQQHHELDRSSSTGESTLSSRFVSMKEWMMQAPGTTEGIDRNINATATSTTATGTTTDLIEVIPSKNNKIIGYRNRFLYNEVRNFLRRNVILENARVRADIQAFRNRLLALHGVDTTATTNQSHAHWKIIGLTQRSGRRRWMNLESVAKNAAATLHKNNNNTNNILFHVVNVEVPHSNMYQQLVWHGAMDALIGIHGAQMTEAIWMKPGSWVVELLPYIPDGVIGGTWTKRTSGPTPLGIIFDGTDLNHVGHPLLRESAPYCLNVSGYDGDPLKCWRENPWADRDFILVSDELVRILESTVLIKKNNNSDATTITNTTATTSDAADTATRNSTHLIRCDEYKDRARDFLVLYNIHCVREHGTTMELHHFYWK